MKIDIHSHGDFSHTLYVNGEPTIQRESFAVCDRVRYALENPSDWEPSECFEVADKIRLTYPDSEVS